MWDYRDLETWKILMYFFFNYFSRFEHYFIHILEK